MRRNKMQMIVLIAFAIIVMANLFVVNRFSTISINDANQQIAQIEKAIKHAAIQCYALEGSYPDQVVYLENNYGVTYDHNRFFVHYRYDSANYIPDIIVFTNFPDTE